MSLLGIDVGTTGCKAAAFSDDGRQLAAAYAEYDVHRPRPGWAELDAHIVWPAIKRVIKEVVVGSSSDPVTALSVSSLGEALVPVKNDRQILGPSIVANFDLRGEEYLAGLATELGNDRLYAINGNTLGPNYSLPKLMWLKEHQPGLYEQADKFLLWGSFVSFMLGAEPIVDYSLANRTLLFDISRETWSEEISRLGDIEIAKLPDAVPSGTVIGRVSPAVAAELGLSTDVFIVAGAHDQCATAVGCGAIQEGSASFGMGTFLCITPVFGQCRQSPLMVERGLNTEHHAVPGKFVTFIYNQGGSLVKWFRDTFAAKDHLQTEAEGQDIYAALISETPEAPSTIMILPHFTTTGPPEYVSDSSGVIVGLRHETSRGDILKGILEGTTFYLKECVESLPPTGIEISDYRAVGGGSKSDVWIQICADILGRPFIRPKITEAGALGAAIIAGVGSGSFASYEAGVAAMVEMDRVFEPQAKQHALYQQRFDHYKRLWPLMQDYLRELAADRR